MKNEVVYVIGHTNPDTDSICSAIAYANLKQKITKGKYKARRAGQINSETRFVLDRFKVDAPAYLGDVRTQVKDVDYVKVKGVSSNISIKKAWKYMGDNKVVTLPVVKNKDRLEGVITVGDITTSYMDIYDSTVIAKAKTSINNIVETLSGELVIGDPKTVIKKGKVLIAAANPDLMESYICEDDLVILGNRYESQFCAIEMNAKCIVVCDGAGVSLTIRKLAQSKGCAIIKSPYDTFTVARLIHQSIPIKYFMKSTDLITFSPDDYIDDIKKIMAKKAHRNFPVIDEEGKFLGMLSRRNLLEVTRKKLILVDHNEKSQAVDGLEETDILEIIDHHRIGSIETMSPVFFRNQPLGCTATIIYQMYEENNVPIEKNMAGLLCSAILSDTLIFKSPTCTKQDEKAARSLAIIAKIDDLEKYARQMFAAGSNLLSKSAEEIFYNDYKKFTAGDTIFCVGQITSMDSEELDKIKEKLLPYLDKAYKEQNVEMILFMLTDIMRESTELLCVGDNARPIITKAFKIKSNDKDVELAGVVSRKKQLIPALMMALQNENI